MSVLFFEDYNKLIWDRKVWQIRKTRYKKTAPFGSLHYWDHTTTHSSHGEAYINGMARVLGTRKPWSLEASSARGYR